MTSFAVLAFSFSIFSFSFHHFFVFVLVFVNEFVIFSFFTFVFVNENHTAHTRSFWKRLSRQSIALVLTTNKQAMDCDAKFGYSRQLWMFWGF